MGATKALTGGREITEKLIPAVARLAQVSYPHNPDHHDEHGNPDEHGDHDDPGDHNDGDHVFSGRKFGGAYLRKDDAEAADGASGL